MSVVLPNDWGFPVWTDVPGSLATFDDGRYVTTTDGVTTWKLADDLARYARMIELGEVEVVVETGTKWGGSALWFETQGVDVITVDIDGSNSKKRARKVAKRTTWLESDSRDAWVVEHVRELLDARNNPRVLVSLDAEHRFSHVVAEISMWAPLVSPGSYLVVEDGIFDLAPTRELQARGGNRIPDEGGPLRAIAWSAAHLGGLGFGRDAEIEQMSPLTHHVAGFWLRSA
jgi:cephalosporin hydroxylase